MATNRRDRDKGDESQGEGLLVGGGFASEPEIVSVTVHPSPTLAASPKPAQQGDIWVSLLESSPWSSNHGGRIEAVQPAPAPARPAESSSVGDLVSRWSQPIWRTPRREEEVETTSESNIVIEVEAPPQAITPDVTVSVSDLMIEVQPVQAPEDDAVASETLADSLARLSGLAEGMIPDESVPAEEFSLVVESEPLVVEPEIVSAEAVAELEPEALVIEAEPDMAVAADVAPEPEAPEEVAVEVEPEPEPEAPEEAVFEPEVLVVEPEPEAPEEVAAEVEPEPEPEAPEEAVDEPEIEIAAQSETAPAPAANSSLSELMLAAAAMTPVLASPPSVAPAAKPVREPAKKKKAAPVRTKAVAVQEVPVEDLLGGIFGIAGSAVRGVFNLGAEVVGGVVGGVVKGGRAIGDSVVSGARRLTGSAGESCGDCSTSQCDAVGKKK
ncbi:hypothetical protein CU669_20515 [Paramagnetospirillum kuznetsovii]|uniref:Magnetosome protein MamJ n=1 Tax=Paramagnetospirillum kuznetsovii TaxID=2053833 RepID=A0A364NSH6_9PROT|nr:magnetosome protein MamJ [Paramagnetospirillum kuznetsovii]RAU20039.1 hypothetical protein CU669_20515 [Paramagnetospirillum kuznetsovii]